MSGLRSFTARGTAAFWLKTPRVLGAFGCLFRHSRLTLIRTVFLSAANFFPAEPGFR